MNKKLAFYASAVTAATTILFAVSMIVGFFAPALNTMVDNSGMIALLFWCIYFAPIMILSAIHFKKAQNDIE